ncbi:IS3 family transposase [Streptomyces sp. NPDC051658]|uniref:IS3 family transposase n=1 Tax=Streptomyces sp. NPDC051658 TaxID=3365667 RepID=UPI0037B45ABB
MKTAAWDFVSAHAEMFGIKRICRVLEVSRSGYYRWITGAEAWAGRQFEEDALVEEIREIHAEHRGNYGALRVHAELRGFGHTVNRKRVARPMRKHGIVGRYLRKKKRTTIPDRLAPPVADLVQRDFTAGTLDEKWCGDITYVQVGAAWLYLACVIDIRSRRVLGWSMAPHMRAELVIDALQAAVATRGGNVTGVIFHADHGSHYTSAAFAQVCDLHGIRTPHAVVADYADRDGHIGLGWQLWNAGGTTISWHRPTAAVRSSPTPPTSARWSSSPTPPAPRPRRSASLCSASTPPSSTSGKPRAPYCLPPPYCSPPQLLALLGVMRPRRTRLSRPLGPPQGRLPAADRRHLLAAGPARRRVGPRPGRPVRPRRRPARSHGR